jgi:hypothetical protein
LRHAALIAGLALFVAALSVPAILFKPDARSNPKLSECGFAVQEGVLCEHFAFGGGGMTSCGRGERPPGTTFVDRQRILEYCKDKDLPVASVLYGYEVVLMGVLAGLIGVFAWFANPLMLVAVVLAAFGKRAVAMVLSVAAVGLALQSYALHGVPFSEASVSPENLNLVDRMGLGFYLWMASLLAFAAYCFLRRPDAAKPQ